MANLVSELLRLKNTLTWSLQGIAGAWQNEKSFRQWSYLNAVSWIALVFVGFASAQTALCVALGVLTLIIELLNSAIEATVDYISTDRHPLAKTAKDLASAAVFLSGMLWGGVWLLFFLTSIIYG